MTFFGLETGGTKFNCAVGKGAEILREARIPTTTPAETIGACLDFFRHAARDIGTPDAIGIAAFGPLELRPDHPGHGRVGPTPKPGWAGADLITPFADAFDVPISIETDVTGAAVGEGAHGAAVGLQSHVYVTVGTGVGGGAVVNGAPLRGAPHPEMGHMLLPRDPEDDFAGICPDHGACLEGLASGPAIAARWGHPADRLGDLTARAVRLEAHYLGAAFANIVAVVAPERIVVGGGVMELSGLLGATRRELDLHVGTYPGADVHTHMDHFLVRPGLGGRSGVVGALVMAERAVEG